MKINDKYPPGTLFAYYPQLYLILKWSISHYRSREKELLCIAFDLKTNKILDFCHESTFEHQSQDGTYKIYE